MKITYNEVMNKLIVTNKKMFINNDSSNIVDIDYSIIDISEEMDLDIYGDYYFLSFRIDKYFCKDKLSLNTYINISFTIGAIWLSQIVKLFPSNEFIFTIQYDDGEASVNHEEGDKDMEGFHVKLFTQEGYDEYFGEGGIDSNNTPYISMSSQ